MNFFGYLVFFLQHYIVPFIMAIGLIFLIYGIIQYFILGPGEEPTREAGRQNFLKAFVWFAGGLALYAAVAVLVWFVTFVAQYAVDGEYDERLQNVPNVPERNN